MAKGLHPAFLEGRTPPPVHIESLENIEWYQEWMHRCFHGYSYRGTRLTGNHLWLLNFFPMERFKEENGVITDKPTFDYGSFSQDDDYFFKQVEEAAQDNKDIMLMTGRGYGKTYNIVSIAAKIYTFIDNAHCVISASSDDHASPTFEKLRAGLNELNKRHPTLAQQRLNDATDFIRAGYVRKEFGKEEEMGSKARIEKIIYDKSPGKSKGRRLDFQHFEEVGDWAPGPGNLSDCISASEGTWYVGKIKRAQVFYTGTGGTVRSTQAKEMFMDPDSYNLYSVNSWYDRKTAIFVPAYHKRGGFWEETGVSDTVAAEKDIDEMRERMKGAPRKLKKFMQEYPKNPDECFMLDGSNRFNQDVIIRQLLKLDEAKEQPGKRGFLHWRKKDGKVVGVDFEEHKDGSIWIAEEPERQHDGQVYPNLYVAGYDGIDLGTQDTASGQGSMGAMSVKKRMLSSKRTNNMYVCHYMDRPKDVNTLYDNCLKISWYFNCRINIEDTKRNIVGFFKQRGQYHRFMKRPRLTLNDPMSEKESNLIGTTATNKNFEFAETFLCNHIDDYGDNLVYRPALEQLRDFAMEHRTKFDLVVSMFMAELADDELHDKMVVPPKPNYVYEEEGYYIDEQGQMKWGVIPQEHRQQEAEFNFNGRMYDSMGNIINSLSQGTEAIQAFKEQYA